MGYRTIAVSDDVYEMLTKIKRKGESYNDVIRRLLRRRNPFKFHGILSDKKYDEFERYATNARHEIKER